MFMEPIPIEPPPAVLAAVVGLAVGLLWIHRITSPGEDPDRPVFRYRAGGAGPLRPPTRRRLARPKLPDPVWRRLTVRWFVTRLEFAVAVVCAALAATPFWLPAFVGYSPRPMFTGPDWGTLLAAAGIVGCLVGLIWMIRIAREPAETSRPVWRSRDD